MDLGLSGTSRLHDLFIRAQAVTPGEHKRAGEGLTIYWTEANTPFGRALFAATDRGLCRLSFTHGEPNAKARLREEWRGGRSGPFG